MKPLYRRASPLPQNIRRHCWIYLDEQLYTSAISILSDVLATTAFTPHGTVFVPPSTFIEVIGCLLVHPKHTSRTLVEDGREIPNRAITFLRTLLGTLGPVNVKFYEAFSFSNAVTNRFGRRNEDSSTHDTSIEAEDDNIGDSLLGTIANNGSLSKCAKDFWHVVGWAFNCSVNHPRRWKFWKIWLDYILDILSADLDEREKEDNLRPKSNQVTDCHPDAHRLESALLVCYLSEVKARSGAVKRVVNSVFADGGLESSKEFPEVFPNEVQGVKARENQKRKRIVLLNSEFRYGVCGDYDENQETLNSEVSSSRNGEPAQPFAYPDEIEVRLMASAWLGGPESVNMRQRLLGLLSRVASLLPQSFTKCVDLYEAIYNCVRPLPLPAFSLLIAPSNSSHFPLMVLVSLTQLILCRLLPNHAPRPESISQRASDDLTQDILEKCLLPFSANTSSIKDNAKVSILVESALRLFMRSCSMCGSPTLIAAVETGITARKLKTKSDKRRRENSSKEKNDEQDLVWLDNSAQRLRALLLVIEEDSPGGVNSSQ